MHQDKDRRVLAIGIDAAEPSLIRRFIERGELPTLGRLLDEGTCCRIQSPANIGSGAVWPTFITGTDPREHGVYGEWCWQPETMSLTRYRSSSSRLNPFWQQLDERGLTIGLLDVPFAPVVGLAKGFEISEWGAHDRLEGRMQASPPSLNNTIIREMRSHPFAAGHPDASGPEDHQGLANLSAACLAGVQLRGEMAARLMASARPHLTIIVFTELHTASHYLWHAVAPTHPLYAQRNGHEEAPAPPATMQDILREIDRQVARLVEIAGADTALFIFSLHGMRPTRGIPTLLDPLLSAWGYAHLHGWSTQTWGERARWLFAAAKRRTPARIKKLYYGAMSQSVTQRLAQTTLLPAYDWRRTRAFSLPTDQHGWIRLNVAGREASGIVSPASYDETCEELGRRLRALRTADGREVVREVIQVSHQAGGSPPQQLPDLIVHWHDAALDDPLLVNELQSEAHPTGLKFTGQHAPAGFCLMKEAPNGDTVAAKDLHRLMVDALRTESVSKE